MRYPAVAANASPIRPSPHNTGMTAKLLDLDEPDVVTESVKSLALGFHGKVSPLKNGSPPPHKDISSPPHKQHSASPLKSGNDALQTSESEGEKVKRKKGTERFTIAGVGEKEEDGKGQDQTSLLDVESDDLTVYGVGWTTS